MNGTISRVECSADGLVGDQVARAINGANVAINLLVVVLLGEFFNNFDSFLAIFLVSNFNFHGFTCNVFMIVQFIRYINQNYS